MNTSPLHAQNGRAGAHRPEPNNPSPTEFGLESLAGLFLRMDACTQVALFETEECPDLRARQLTSAPDAAISANKVQALLQHRGFTPSASGWFHMAREADPFGHSSANRISSLLGLRFSDGLELLGGGVVACSKTPSPRELGAIHDLCGLGQYLLEAKRERRIRQSHHVEAADYRSRMAEALTLGADAYWETDTAGMVRHLVIVGHEKEASLVRHLESKDIGSLISGLDRISAKMALGSSTFRDRRIVLRGLNHPDIPLDLSGYWSADSKIWRGIARCVRQDSELRTTDHKFRGLIEKLEASKEREAALRHEAEIVLDGLRILTRPQNGHEIFAALLELLAPVLEFQAALILQREWSGQFVVAAATAPALRAIDWQSSSQKLFNRDDIAFAFGIPDDLALAKTGASSHWQSGLAIKLIGGSKAALLLCLHGKPNFFLSRHTGLGARLSLVAGQAFMNEEERQKVVDASKLATIGEMAAGIVHEINQPLSAMSLAVENLGLVLDSGKADPEKIRSTVSRLQTQIERVVKIVKSMRGLARHSDGALDIFNVNEAIADAVTIIQHTLKQDAIELELHFASDLHAHGNRLEFTQVVVNLLSNARDAIQAKCERAAPGHEGPRRIKVYSEANDPDWLELRVRDTGCGLPEQAQEKVFEPFFTTKSVGKGTGLGLALCKRIVQNMGGSIDIGNWLGGAEVRIRLAKHEM